MPPEGYSFVSFDGEMPNRFDAPASTAMARRIPDWLAARDSVVQLSRQAKAAGRAWTFGWLLPTTDHRVDDLEEPLAAHGAEVLGTAGNLVRARLPGDEERLRRVVAMPGIRAVAPTPEDIKIAPAFAREVLQAPEQRRPVFITLMADDRRGHLRTALTESGAVVGAYDAALRMYTAVVDGESLRRAVRADFVLTVEPVGVVKAVHDTAVPAMGVDSLRIYTGSPGVFSGNGGASVPIGVMDTGLNIRHADIATHRESICGANFVPMGEEDLWFDVNGHGTHVTGTIVGNGYATAGLAGMAPSVGHVRFAKVLNHGGWGTHDSIVRGMDFLGRPSDCEDSRAAMPQIVNLSFAISSRLYEGRGATARKLDAVVWDTGQLYVVAQANAGNDGLSSYASAKNSLPVGAAFDGGEIAPFSSHGPTGDGRLAPLVIATGFDVCSATGDGSPAGYDCRNGTSLASPTVAGVAALLMDAVPGYRLQPALVRARLMAGAIRPDAWLEDGTGFPLNNSEGPGGRMARYGLGKVSARTSVLAQDDVDGWIGGGATAELGEEGDYAYLDIVVPAGASRLDVVMTWDEPPADAVVAPVLNDLDLWLDEGGDCDGGPCGERASTSRIDNVEWIFVKNPTPGTYRVKVVANRIYAAPPRAGVAWTVIRGSSTPNLELAAEVRTVSEQADERELELDLRLTSGGYVAAGTRLHIACRGQSADCQELEMSLANVAREDGLLSSDTAVSLDSRIPLGEVGVDETQTLTLDVAYSGESAVRLYVVASAWNARGASSSVVVQPPGEDSDHPEAGALRNDDFAAAVVIEGKEGSTDVDLVRATPEPGEPLYRPHCRDSRCAWLLSVCKVERPTRWYERPLGSVWHTWTAPETGLATFRVALQGDQPLDGIFVSAFEGDRIGALDEVATNHSEDHLFIVTGASVTPCIVRPRRTFHHEVSFVAEAGRSYRIRVAAHVPSEPLVLHWSHGRPANDDFSMAEMLAGTEGRADGSNAGATLEAGESFGHMAATVWYRWTAPGDGDWTFTLNDAQSRVAAFAGTGVRDVRLVSGFPASAAHFRARAGTPYHIMVAAEDAYAHPGRFALSWHEASSWHAVRDHFEQAQEAVFGEDQDLSLDDQTVEPDEPVETGVRTQWWSWIAPETRTYSWKLDGLDDLAVGIFRGAALAELEPVATAVADEFTFAANGGVTYSVSVGWPVGDARAYLGVIDSGVWRLGATPANDEAAGAIALDSTRGLIPASPAYATTARGESKDFLGRWSLWWTYEAPISGWYRFQAVGDLWTPDVALAIYDSDNLDVPVSQSGWLNDANEVTFFAEAGKRYTIRSGIQRYIFEPDFTLTWEPTDAPTWLGYAGAYSDQIDNDGDAVRITNPGNLAFDEDGNTLFAATDLGLAVFTRNASEGGLTPTQSVEADVAGSSFLWDARRKRLLSNRCEDWLAFEAAGGSDPVAFEAAVLEVADDTGSCGTEIFAVGGSSVYRVVPGDGIEHFAVGESGEVGYVDSLQVPGLRHAVAAADGTLVYASTESSLDTLERNMDTGTLVEGVSLSGPLGGPIAITAGDEFIFVNDTVFQRTYGLALNGGTPRWLGSVAVWLDLARLVWTDDRSLQFAVARRGHPAVDLIVDDGLVSVRLWRSDELAIGDELGDGLDRFGNYVPLFGTPMGMAASRDGAHLYVSTTDHGILAFDRIPADFAVDGFLRLRALTVAAGMVALGSEQSGACIALSDAEIDGNRYTARTSKWQTRPNADWPWVELADTEASGEVCPYAPLAPGHYRLIVDLDVNGVSGQYASNAILEDDHGDSIDDATLVAVPSATPGWIESTADDDYFGVVLDEAGNLDAFTEGWTDIDGRLYTDDGDIVASDHDSGHDLNFRFSASIEAGTYYVRVGSPFGAGAYTLHLTFDAAADEG